MNENKIEIIVTDEKTKINAKNIKMVDLLYAIAALCRYALINNKLSKKQIKEAVKSVVEEV